ncbi:MAG: hypothetical protein ACLFRR_01755 [Spirochaetaceae bacterium]
MKRLALVLFFVCSTATIPAFAETEAFGLGVLLGEPTGISAKARLGPTSAIDAAAAWSFRGEGSFYFHADYLVHFTDIFHVDPGEMPLYVGVGGKIALRDDPQLGVRIPVGIAYEFESVPLDVFFEVAPGVGLFPETDIDFGGGLGIRYYFAGGSSGS